MAQMDWDRVRRGWRAGGYPPGEPVWVDLPPSSTKRRKKRKKGTPKAVDEKTGRSSGQQTGRAGPKRRQSWIDRYPRLTDDDLTTGTWIVVPWRERVRVNSFTSHEDGTASITYGRVNKSNRVRTGSAQLKVSGCKLISEESSQLEEQYQRALELTKRDQANNGGRKPSKPPKHGSGTP